MSRTDEEIKRYETKMKSCTTMTEFTGSDVFLAELCTKVINLSTEGKANGR